MSTTVNQWHESKPPRLYFTAPKNIQFITNTTTEPRLPFSQEDVEIFYFSLQEYLKGKDSARTDTGERYFLLSMQNTGYT